MNLVEEIQLVKLPKRIEFLYEHIDELEKCNEADLTRIGLYACHASNKLIRREYPIIGDLSDAEYDLDMEVFGDPDDPTKPGSYVPLNEDNPEESGDYE